jgi:hypothetical protein
VSTAAADVIDEALEQLLEGVAEETRIRRAAEERMDQMERDCAEAMLQACALAERRIAADREASEQRGHQMEREWVLGLIGMLLDELQDGGGGAAALQSLRRMVEQGPIRIAPECSGLVA